MLQNHETKPGKEASLVRVCSVNTHTHTDAGIQALLSPHLCAPGPDSVRVWVSAASADLNRLTTLVFRSEEQLLHTQPRMNTDRTHTHTCQTHTHVRHTHTRQTHTHMSDTHTDTSHTQTGRSQPGTIHKIRGL